MSKFMTCSIAVLMLSGAAAKVQAAPDEGRPIVINYADLDMASPAGGAVLRARVAAGVARFCGPEPSLMNLSAQAAYRDCIADATAATMAKAETLMAKRQTQPIQLSQAGGAH